MLLKFSFFILPCRGVGCIFYEMNYLHSPFPGSTVEEELDLIFRKLGTPTEATWPGIGSNEEFLSYNFPAYPGKDIFNHPPNDHLLSDGLDLLQKFLKVTFRALLLFFA